jgi:hypothetical protein
MYPLLKGVRCSRAHFKYRTSISHSTATVNFTKNPSHLPPLAMWGGMGSSWIWCCCWVRDGCSRFKICVCTWVPYPFEHRIRRRIKKYSTRLFKDDVLDGNGMSYIYFSLSCFGICFSDFNVLKVDHNSHIHYCVCVFLSRNRGK